MNEAQAVVVGDKHAETSYHLTSFSTGIGWSEFV